LAPTKYTAGLGWGVQQVLLIALLSFLLGLTVAVYGPLLNQTLLKTLKGGPSDVTLKEWFS